MGVGVGVGSKLIVAVQLKVTSAGSLIPIEAFVPLIVKFVDTFPTVEVSINLTQNIGRPPLLQVKLSEYVLVSVADI